ncbi:MAG: isovaleryl-CoA dehydrogenase [Deltaproteobacteria bacterium]|jgi:putative acyl-CoA dehydrogenase|nr:isovaleryl-CoA dehydrogenase [Deltaproteobacteria bacterium]
MPIRSPINELPTHHVANQPTHLENYNLFELDVPLAQAVERYGAQWSSTLLQSFGRELGLSETIEHGRLANRNKPELKTYDRFGHRIDEVDFHPSYHHMMKLGMQFGVHSLAWKTDDTGGHVAHTALEYLLGQIEGGVCCPLTMTYAAVPALQNNSELAKRFLPKLLSNSYDPRCIPISEKDSMTMGMAMTEKQGGSDVRSNTSRAVPTEDTEWGPGWHLTGHKWFCSAPMSDAFLTLAQTSKGLSCFLVPRFRPDGTRNNFFIQRLKDKLGNQSNASSEIEYDRTFAVLVGEEGRGVSTIIEMVHHTRLDCTQAAAGIVRQSLTQALHHTMHRKAFGKLLIHQPLMRNVLADIALESEAMTAMVFRIANLYDESKDNSESATLARLAVAVGKYWCNKRVPMVVAEAMECHGGAGYVEESVMPRLYREAPLNGIWEGSGNVICLDVLRTIHKEPACLELLLTEIEKANGQDPYLDRSLDVFKKELRDQNNLESRARRITEKLALLFQASLLVQHTPSPVYHAFCRSRLEGDWGYSLGTLDPGVDQAAILTRAHPEL